MKTKSGKCTYCGKRTERNRHDEFIHERCEMSINFYRGLVTTALMIELLRNPKIVQKLREINTALADSLELALGERNGHD
jgi:hypothetical protein